MKIIGVGDDKSSIKFSKLIVKTWSERYQFSFCKHRESLIIKVLDFLNEFFSVKNSQDQ